MTKLSIVAIIPLYNGARWIEQAIRSVFAQTIQPDEFIVVDDGSTDDGAGSAIVKQLAKERPITLLTKPNGGQSSARNFGVAHSKSALIALLDQDDAWYPRHLAELRRPFEADVGSSLGWVYSNLDLVMDDGKMFSHCLLDDMKVEHPKLHLSRCLSEDMHILPSASLFHRAAFEAVGGFDECLSGYEDDDLFLRMFCQGWRNVYLREALSFWRMTNSSSSYTPRMAASRMLYAHKLLREFPDNRPRQIWLARDCIAPKFFTILVSEFLQAVGDRDRKVAKRTLADMAEIAPYMRPKIRLLFTTFKPFLASWPIVRAAYHARLILRPITARVVT